MQSDKVAEICLGPFLGLLTGENLVYVKILFCTLSNYHM